MLLKFENVTFSYKQQDQPVLIDICLDVDYGEKVALLGLNGAGKSTLMLHTNGLLIPTSGKVKVDGLDTDSKSIDKIRRKVGFVFQNPDDQLFMPTVWEDIAFGPINMGLKKDEINHSVNEALSLIHVEHLAHKAPFELSGGQKKAVSIAAVLSMSPDLLVMDEPTSGMDYKTVENFISLIEKLPQALLISTHDIALAKRICNRAIILDSGKIIYDGDIKNMVYPPVGL